MNTSKPERAPDGELSRSPGDVDWDGRPLAPDGAVALLVLPECGDTDDYPVPALAAACAGGEAVVLSSDRLGGFLRAHAGRPLVRERSGFFHGMIEKHLRQLDDEEGLARLMEFSKAGRLFDVILMDQLLDLAEHGVEKNPRKVDELVRERCGANVPRPAGIGPLDADRAQGRVVAASLAMAPYEAYIPI